MGTVLAVQFAQHLPQRRMLLGYAVLLVVGSILAAAAQNAGMFIAGHVIQGLCTSLLLIAAVPPLAIGYPANKLRDTAVIMNMCIFGAVALGPFVGGLQAQSARLAAVVLDRRRDLGRGAGAGRPDVRGLAARQPRLAARPAGDRAWPASAASPRSSAPRSSRATGFLEPEACSCRCSAAWRRSSSCRLPVPRQAAAADDPHDADQHDARSRESRWRCSPRRRRCRRPSSRPRSLAGRYSPLHIGVLYLPELAGAVITAVALGLVITKRAMHYLPLVGMVVLAAGIVVFRIEVPSSQALTLVGSA